MPVADTELLFLPNPRDPRHKYALRILEEMKGRILVPDVALLEFEITLRSRSRSLSDIKLALLALKKIFDDYEIKEVKTVNILMLNRHIEIMMNYKLSFFDSLIASAALQVDSTIISDDVAYDQVIGLKRIPITKL